MDDGSMDNGSIISGEYIEENVGRPTPAVWGAQGLGNGQWAMDDGR